MRQEQGNFVDILQKALRELPEGKIEFSGPGGGFVSVTFIEGDIQFVESSWGTGNEELKRIYEWKSGTCFIKDLTPEEKKILETKWQRPVILETGKKQQKDEIGEIPKKIEAILKEIRRKDIDLDAFLSEVHDKRYSGEARIITPRGKSQVLFYQGLPIINSDRRTPSLFQVHEMMDHADALINFYLLGNPLTHAALSLFAGERLWDKISITLLELDKFFAKLMEQRPTGHICVYKKNGSRCYSFFYQGVPLGFYDIDNHWAPIETASIWEGAEQLDYYHSTEIGPLFTAAQSLQAARDFVKFLSEWNVLLEEIAKKIGKKPMEKALQRHFGEIPQYQIDGLRLLIAGKGDQVAQDALRGFKGRALELRKEVESIVGSRWLEVQLEGFNQRHGDLIERLSLKEVFERKGG